MDRQRAEVLTNHMTLDALSIALLYPASVENRVPSKEID